MKINLNELRDFIEIDKQSRVDLLRDTFAKIASQLEDFMREQNAKTLALENGEKKQDEKLKQQKERYHLSIKSLEDSIQ